jgi:hypothetical protein
MNKKHDVRDYLTKEEFIRLRYEDNYSCENIKEISGFKGHANTLRRQTANLGWRKAITTFKSNDNFFKNNSRESAWVLGWLITDGHVNKDFIKIDLNKKDTDVLQKIKELLKFEGNIYESRLANGIKIYNKNLVNDLYEIGIPKIDKTFNCIFPNVDSNYMWDFIRGAFEGDGSIVIHRGTLQLNICGASPKFMLAIKKFLSDNGVKLRVEERDNGLVVLHTKDMASAIRWSYFMYSNTTKSIRMDRKFNKYIEFLDTFYNWNRKSSEAIELVELSRQTILKEVA